MLYRCTLILLAVVLAHASQAQTWERIGNNNFTYIAGVDSALLMISEPGTVLRSEDSGRTWHKVFRTLRTVTSIVTVPSQHTILLVTDSVAFALSIDDGRSWGGVDHERRVEEKDAKSETQGGLLTSNYSLRSSCTWRGLSFACGDHGLVVSLADSVHELILHAEPVAQPGASEMSVDFEHAANGVVVYGGRLFVTHDSGVTWRPTNISDSSLGCVLMLSNTSWLVALGAGRIAITINDGETYQLDTLGTALHLRHFGWRNILFREIAAVTDSAVYLLSLSQSTEGGRGIARSDVVFTAPLNTTLLDAAFQDSYVGYAIYDSIAKADSVVTDLAGMPKDSIITRHSCTIVRTLDGGSSWSRVAQGLPKLHRIACHNGGRVFAIGDYGGMYKSEDSGSTWAKVGAMTRQCLNDIAVGDKLGMMVGDSGFVVVSQCYRPDMIPAQSWKVIPPEPLFLHPGTGYTTLSLPDANNAYVAGDGRIWHAIIPDPTFDISWKHDGARIPKEHKLDVYPNPVNDLLYVVHPRGSLIVSDSYGHTVPLPATQSTVDVTSLAPGIYFVSDGKGKSKFVKE